MAHIGYFKPGDNNAICDRCGKPFKASELRKTWDGLWVCRGDWEPRHPQDFVRGVKDDQSVRVSRPPPAVDTFVYTPPDYPLPPDTSGAS